MGVAYSFSFLGKVKKFPKAVFVIEIAYVQKSFDIGLGE